MILRLAVALLSLLSLAGCVTGKRSEDKTGYDRWNGQNYDAPLLINGGGIPLAVGDQKPRVTRVSGHVFVGQGLERVAAGGVSIVVLKDSKVLAETQIGG